MSMHGRWHRASLRDRLERLLTRARQIGGLLHHPAFALALRAYARYPGTDVDRGLHEIAADPDAPRHIRRTCLDLLLRRRRNR